MYTRQLIGLFVLYVLISGAAVVALRRGRSVFWLTVLAVCVGVGLYGAALEEVTGFPPAQGRFEPVAAFLMLFAAAAVPASLAAVILAWLVDRGRVRRLGAQFALMFVSVAVLSPLGAAASIGVELLWYH